jgi:hypothetical protein
MFESTATLYGETITQDAALNEVVTYTPRTVFLRRSRSIYSNEFYAAAAQGLKPAAVLVLFFADYEGEKVLGWEGKIYNVTRTYRRPDSDDLEITIEERLEHFAGLEGQEG